MEGWVKLHRKLLNWEWINSPRELRLFIELLLRANHKKTNWRGIEILPGQIITGRKQLSNWTGLTERQIRTSLANLKSTNELTIKTTNTYSVITLVNWLDYQEEATNETTIKQSVKRPANDHQTTTSNNVYNENNEKNNKKQKLSDSETIKNFTQWFNGMLFEYRGKEGKFSTMSKTDINNLKRLRETYNFDDFKYAFARMMENQWVIDNNKATIDHFLANNNFMKYLNTPKDVKPKIVPAWG